MQAIISFITGTLNTVAWLYIFLPCTILFGLYLTIRNRGLQFTKFGYVMKNTLGKMFQKQEAGEGAVTPMQAVSTALAATVGTGNIVALWNESPLKYAPNCNTPTLFIHSDEDWRCPLPDALEMFSCLKRAGCPARLCLFHGENHELSRSGRPDNRITRLQEILNWFKAYLQ